MTATTTKEHTVSLSAPAISAFLRRQGFNPVAPADTNREGLKVKGSGDRVRVVADLDSPEAAARMASDAADALVEAGYGISTMAEGDDAFYVEATTRPARDDDYTPAATEAPARRTEYALRTIATGHIWDQLNVRPTREEAEALRLTAGDPALLEVIVREVTDWRTA